uniref:Uncharacterized protein n=1 Tax=Lobelia laxa TaxID=2041130 RepID=A0A291EZ07_9ASTR|nr:hypothetical protein Lo_lxa1Pt0921 [Lobelia laxa]YP_009435113.1 hypothetical protein Lo_lxa1Pt1575 [Lobelia laxa]ATG25091.1 hypothetical protein Lo_lxa1Pt0921 [Lobelia laxa]ATG25116.1 hypothetical protein Lo_lxa1Pt1575 [Lobelia laxa]
MLQKLDTGRVHSHFCRALTIKARHRNSEIYLEFVPSIY